MGSEKDYWWMPEKKKGWTPPVLETDDLTTDEERIVKLLRLYSSEQYERRVKVFVRFIAEGNWRE